MQACVFILVVISPSRSRRKPHLVSRSFNCINPSLMNSMSERQFCSSVPQRVVLALITKTSEPEGPETQCSYCNFVSSHQIQKHREQPSTHTIKNLTHTVYETKINNPNRNPNATHKPIGLNQQVGSARSAVRWTVCVTYFLALVVSYTANTRTQEHCSFVLHGPECRTNKTKCLTR